MEHLRDQNLVACVLVAPYCCIRPLYTLCLSVLHCMVVRSTLCNDRRRTESVAAVPLILSWHIHQVRSVRPEPAENGISHRVHKVIMSAFLSATWSHQSGHSGHSVVALVHSAPGTTPNSLLGCLSFRNKPMGPLPLPIHSRTFIFPKEREEDCSSSSVSFSKP